jgi:hypothetical protein
MQALGWRYVLFPGLFGALLLMGAAAVTDELARAHIHARMCSVHAAPPPYNACLPVSVRVLLCVRRSGGSCSSWLTWRGRCGWAAAAARRVLLRAQLQPSPQPHESARTHMRRDDG